MPRIRLHNLGHYFLNKNCYLNKNIKTVFRRLINKWRKQKRSYCHVGLVVSAMSIPVVAASCKQQKAKNEDNKQENKKEKKIKKHNKTKLL